MGPLLLRGPLAGPGSHAWGPKLLTLEEAVASRRAWCEPLGAPPEAHEGYGPNFTFQVSFSPFEGKVIMPPPSDSKARSLAARQSQ